MSYILERLRFQHYKVLINFKMKTDTHETVQEVLCTGIGEQESPQDVPRRDMWMWKAQQSSLVYRKLVP